MEGGFAASALALHATVSGSAGLKPIGRGRMARVREDGRSQDPLSTSRQILRQSSRDLNRAWEGFLSGKPREELTARNLILDSWERCQASEVSLATAWAPRVNQDNLAMKRRENQALLRASAETLADAANILHQTDTIMLVTDAAGIVLEGAGDSPTLRAGHEIALCDGGDWRERSAGTNGIGVALATRQPILVHAGEHYCEPMRAWSCAAAPIIDPSDGSVAGILNLSARNPAAGSQLFALAVLCGRRIEQAMMQDADMLRARLMELALEQSRQFAWDAVLAIDLKGRLTFSSKDAAHLLHDRFDVRLLGSAPGQRAFNLKAGGNPLPEIPQDWVRPLTLDGNVGGYMIVVPAKSRSRPRRPVPPMDRSAETVAARSGFSALVGDSPALQAAIMRSRRVAPLDVPVLLEGETGVGKELFARAIHGASQAANGPLVIFNCGAITRELIASELFGYAKGAFTGASADGRAGRFELADEGTLCLDEVGELPLDLQPYLLRVLEEGAVTRVGENTPRRVKVRIIASTNRDLRAEVDAGRFRRDLYHRLSVVSLTVPSLREREGDLERLLAHFSAQFAERHQLPVIEFTPAVMARLKAHDWPGNIRELKNVVESSALFSDNGMVRMDCLPQYLAFGTSESVHDEPGGDLAAIQGAIDACSGNISQTCKALGISRSTLYRRMARHKVVAARHESIKDVK